MSLPLHSPAPDFTLPSTSGTKFTLSKDAKGSPVILFFYPQDFTPGCTKEACSFRDNFAEFRNLRIPVYGISTDSIESHLKFKKQYNLPFDLLSDKSGKVSSAYKAKILFFNKSKRVTYLLDKDHKVAAAYENMLDAEKHIKKMIEEVQG
jgi:thioredoxin-dependent peroxiredoxin